MPDAQRIAELFILAQQHKDLCWKAHIARKPESARIHAVALAGAAQELAALLHHWNESLRSTNTPAAKLGQSYHDAELVVGPHRGA